MKWQKARIISKASSGEQSSELSEIGIQLQLEDRKMESKGNEGSAVEIDKVNFFHTYDGFQHET